jgi:NADH-quinone oxidoreductase subunit M
MFLSGIIFLPILFAAVLAVVPKNSIRLLSLVLGSLYFLFSLMIFASFIPSSAAIQMAENRQWLPSFGVSYFVGVDGLSLWLVLLTTLLTPIVVLASWNSIHEKIRGFHACLFLLTSFMVGSFLALDAILFYVFFEASLIPMYFMIGIWGGQRRLYATVKFFIYTMFGSLFMLLGLIAIMFLAYEQLGYLTANLLDWYKLEIPFVGGELLSTQTLLLLAFSLAFAIKVPMFPFHTWLPDAHVEAPTPGSVILAAVMLKMGTYGFLRFVLPLFPEAASYWSWVFMLLAVVGIIYGALVAMVQPDIKKLVAYSSVSHMGYVILGLFAFNSFGVTGAIYQMLSHGISTGALFLMVGMVYERTHSREISRYGGMAKAAPWFTILFLIVTFSSIAVPMTNGFVGEFLILLGAFRAQPSFAVVAVSGVILGAAYMLWVVKKVFFGAESELVHEHAGELDLRPREFVILAPFIALIFVMGLAPNWFFHFSKASISHLVDSRGEYRLELFVPDKTKKSLLEESGE